MSQPVTLTTYRLDTLAGAPRLRVYTLDTTQTQAEKIEDRVFATLALRTAALKALLTAGATNCADVTRYTTVAGVAYAVRDRLSRDYALYLRGDLVGWARSSTATETQLRELAADVVAHEAVTAAEAEQAMTDAASEADAARAGRLAAQVGCTPAQVVEALAHFVAHPVTAAERATLAEIDAEAEAAYAALADDEALARQLVGELAEYDTLGLPSNDGRYDAKSKQVRRLGYEIGPDGQGGLCLWRSDNRGPLESARPRGLCDDCRTLGPIDAAPDNRWLCAACQRATQVAA